MSSNQRDLSKLKLRAALEAHRQVTLSEIQEIPLATVQNKKYFLPLYCKRSGLLCGSMTTIAVAGAVPVLGQWKDTMILHPLFSMPPVALLQFARNSWVRFCALSPEETADTEVVKKQEEQLRVVTLAMLHNLTEVRQDIPWMPEFTDVVTNWTALMSICYWRAYLDSIRFKFPQLRISRLEKDVDLKSFLRLCFDAKKSYETNVSVMIDEEERKRIAAAEKAMMAIRADVAGKKPLNPKILWRWFELNMPTRYKKDLAGWMKELFFATDKTIFEFTIRDIELFEETFLVECPTGSSISHAFLEVLRGKHSLLSQHFQTYEILIPNTIAAGIQDGSISVDEEPRLADYPSRVKWLIAHSKWRLAQPSARKHSEAEAARQRTESVPASFKPKFQIGPEELPEIDSSDEPTDIFLQQAMNADMGASDE